MAIGTTMAVLAGLSAGSSIFGAVKSSKAATKGANAQVQATEDASKMVTEAANGVNPQLIESARQGAEGVSNAGETAAGAVNNAAQYGIGRVDNAATAANGYLDPYAQAGQSSLASLNGLAEERFQFDPNSDPGAQHVMRNAMRAIERSAAARGGLSTGGTLVRLQNRAGELGDMQVQQAFSRFNADRASRAGIYGNLATMGLSAGNQAGQNLTQAGEFGAQMGYQGERDAGMFRTRASEFAGDMNFQGAVRRGANTMQGAEYTADTLAGIGEARGGAHLGRANAWNQVLGGSANAAYSLSQLGRRRPEINT